MIKYKTLNPTENYQQTMKCLICQKEIPTVLGYVSNCQRYCQSCFLFIVEKRIRKYIREHAKLKKDQRIVATEPVAQYFATQVIHVPVNILKKQKEKTDTHITLVTLDDVVVRFLEYFFLGKKRQKKKKTELWLFAAVTDEELALYCTYKRIKFTPQKHVLKDLIQQLEKQHPGALYSLYKSAQELEDIL